MSIVKIVVFSAIIGVIFFSTFQCMPNKLSIEKIDIEGKKTVSVPDFLVLIDPNLPSDTIVKAQPSSRIAVYSTFFILFSGIILRYFLSKLYVSFVELMGKYSFWVRRYCLHLSHSWLKNYGICRTSGTCLLHRYYELLELVSEGFVRTYYDPKIQLSFNGTVTELVERYQESESLQQIFRTWKRLCEDKHEDERENVEISRIFFPTSKKLLSEDQELSKLALSIYTRFTGKITTKWSHDRADGIKEYINNIRKLSPNLDFAVLTGCDKKTGDMKCICVGYVRNYLVYKLQTTDITEEHASLYSKLSTNGVQNLDSLIGKLGTNKNKHSKSNQKKKDLLRFAKRKNTKKNNRINKMSKLEEQINKGEIEV